jgi:hypothetical protein
MKAASLRTIETPYRNARGNVVALQEGRTGAGDPLWHEAEVWPGRKAIGRVGTGDWPDLPTALAALDRKYGGAAAINPEPAQPTETLEPGQLSEEQERALCEHEAGHVTGIPPWSDGDDRATREALVDLARRNCIDVAGAADSEPPPPPVADPPWACDATADPRFAIAREETLSPTFTQWHLNNGWVIIRCDGKDYRQCGWRFSAWEPAADPGGLAAFRAGGDAMHELVAKLPAAAACVPEGSPTMPRDASAPDAAPDPPAPAPVAPGRGRGGRRKAPAAGQGSLFD